MCRRGTRTGSALWKERTRHVRGRSLAAKAPTPTRHHAAGADAPGPGHRRRPGLEGQPCPRAKTGRGANQTSGGCSRLRLHIHIGGIVLGSGLATKAGVGHDELPPTGRRSGGFPVRPAGSKRPDPVVPILRRQPRYPADHHLISRDLLVEGSGGRGSCPVSRRSKT